MQPDLNLCPGCMEPIGSEAVCPHCGYTAGSPYLAAYLAPGSVLNEHYIAGKLLHYNGESAVYIGYDTAASAKVFIKEYMPDALCRRLKDSPIVAVNQDSVAQYKTFMSEFVELNKSLAKLRSLGHINPAVDMFGANNTGYVIFDYIEGMTLTEYLRLHGGSLSWETTKRLFAPFFTTLSLVHNAGLVHRGLHPDNIVITPSEELVLMGFCIPDARTANTELNPEIYNGYAAPEQYSSGKWQGTQTDVYGMSALLYRVLTGAVPQDAEERLANDSLLEPSAINPDISANISDAVMNGLILDSERRIHTITELVTKLFEEPEEIRAIHKTQTISIPVLHTADAVSDEDEAAGFGRNDERSYQRSASVQRNKSRTPSKNKVFISAALISAVVLIALMAVIMIALDDTSSGANRITVTESPLADIDDVSGALTYQTTLSEETESPLTDDEHQSIGDPVSTDQSDTTGDGNFYIMNELVGKNYETIKNSPTYASLSFVPEYEFNEENTKGTIFEQSIPKGESYSEGAQVTIKVSLGSRYVTVPEYIGMRSKDYFNLLEGKNIKYEQVSYETSDYADGYVCGISAEDGEVLDLESGETLIVYVAYNPAPETTTTEETEETTTEEETEETTEEFTETEETETETEYTEDTEYTEEEYPDDEDGEIEIDDPDFEEDQG